MCPDLLPYATGGGKVMFLQLSVTLFWVRRCLPLGPGGVPPRQTAPWQTPPGHTPPGRHTQLRRPPLPNIHHTATTVDGITNISRQSKNPTHSHVTRL